MMISHRRRNSLNNTAAVSSLKEKKMFMLDMDGTIYNENTLIPGAKEFFQLLQKRGIHYTFMTNNSSKSKLDYVEKLQKLGIECTEKHIASSVNATVAFLKSNKSDAKIYLVGTNSLKQELESQGFTIVPPDYRQSDVDYVLVGFDTELNYEKLKGACWYISRDYPFIATNCDLRCPVLENKFIPDCGAICNMITAATEKKPLFLGKPDKYIVESVMKDWDLKPEEVATVGDRLYTDIAVGVNAGVDSICVLTGEATSEDISQSSIKPTYVFNSIKELYEKIL